MMSTLLIAVLISATNAQSSQQCIADYECEKQDITADQIDCIGFKSCLAASLTSNNRKNGYIDCSGFQSCYAYQINKAQFPAILTASGNIYCSGNNACINVGAINANNVYCTGGSSCGSDLDKFTLTSNKHFYCYGTNSCWGAAIESGKKTFCGARHACANTKITGGIAVHCDGFNGCQSAQLLRQRRFVCCAGGNTCSSTDIRNVDEIRAYGDKANIASKINGAAIVKGYGYRSLSYATIDSDSVITVEAFGDSAGENANLICRNGGVCTLLCKGTGCEGLTYKCLSGATCNIAPVGCLQDNSIAQVNGIICPTFTDTIGLDENYNPEEWMDKERNEVVTDDCQAKRECVNEVIQGYSNGCNGEESCQGATIESGIYCNGAKSCELSIIDNRGTSAYSECNGYQSCFKSDIKSTSWTGYFQCQGAFGCGQATVEAEIIICSGKYSCAVSDINATDFISIEGYFGAARSTLFADEVRIYGHKSLFLGTIDSIGRDTLTVESLAHLGGDSGSVICRTGSTCTLTCATSGCKNLDYICESGAVCNIEPAQCDGSRNTFKGIDCPTRTSSVFADDYMVKKYEMNRDVYDAFDSFIDNVVVNYNDEDMDEYDTQEEVFANSDIGLMEKDIKEYNMNVFLVVVSAVIIGLLCLWCRARGLKNEYESI